MPTIQVMAKDGKEFYEAIISDLAHLPALNKLCPVRQQAYIVGMKNRSYESKIQIKWICRGNFTYLNVHLLKLTKKNMKRISRSSAENVENNKRKSSVRNMDNDSDAPCKKANQGVTLTKQTVATATNVPTLAVDDIVGIATRNKMYNKMNTFLDKAITKGYDTDGREYWPGNIRHNPILIKSIADESVYDSVKQYINIDKKFTTTNKVFPIYLSSSSKYVFLSTFRYRVPEASISEADNNHTLGYYEARAIYKGVLVNYTVSKDYLDTLDEVNFGELHENKNKWSDIRFGDKNKLETTNLVHTGDTTSVNHFTHKNTPYISCMLSAVASAMWAMGIYGESISFFKKFQSTLHVDCKNLWKNLHVHSGKAFPDFKFRKTLTPGGISAAKIMEMNDEWAFVLQIISSCGLPSHCICICNGVIYDANSITTLPKTLANLHLCAKLHTPEKDDQFFCTKWIRRLIPQNMVLKNNPRWDTVLPRRDAWNFGDPPRNCVVCCQTKLQIQFSKTQWRKASPKCSNCIP